MTQEATVPENDVATTPLLLKAIAGVFFVLPLTGLLYLIFGRLPAPREPVPPFITFVDHSFNAAICSAEVIGAVLLARLRKSTLTLFAGALILGLLNSCWRLFIRRWIG